jgi:hypothetical protein
MKSLQDMTYEELQEAIRRNEHNRDIARRFLLGAVAFKVIVLTILLVKHIL